MGRRETNKLFQLISVCALIGGACSSSDEGAGNNMAPVQGSPGITSGTPAPGSMAGNAAPPTRPMTTPMAPTQAAPPASPPPTPMTMPMAAPATPMTTPMTTPASPMPTPMTMPTPPSSPFGGGGFPGFGGGGGMEADPANAPDFTPPTGDGCLNGGGDYTQNGPYRVGMMDVTIGSEGAYTVFYPTEMQDGCHPVVAWGNGTAVEGSAVYGFYQDHAASYGVIVVASHNANTGSGMFHTSALDWAFAQNEDPSSMFYGKLNGRAGTSGHSQGGAGANAGSRHAAVEAIGNVQGAFGRAPAGKAFLCLTGTEDIATQGCKTSVDSTSSPALYANWEGGNHVGTATLAGFIGGDKGTRQYMRLYTAWFRCFLGDDANACAMFMGGESCPVCQDSGWAEIYAKNY